MNDAANEVDVFSQSFCEAFVAGNEDERRLLCILHRLGEETAGIGAHPRNGVEMLRDFPLSNLQRNTRRALVVLRRNVREESKFWGTGAMWVNGNIADRLRTAVVEACQSVAVTITIHEKREVAQQAWSQEAELLSELAVVDIQNYMLGEARGSLEKMIRAMCLQKGIDPEPLLCRLVQEFNTLYRRTKCDINETALTAYRWISHVAAGIEPHSPPEDDEDEGLAAA